MARKADAAFDVQDARENNARSGHNNHLRERVRKAFQIPHERPSGHPMKAKLHALDCDEEDLIELPDSWIPVRLEHNGYARPNRKAYTLYYLVRA